MRFGQFDRREFTRLDELGGPGNRKGSEARVGHTGNSESQPCMLNISVGYRIAIHASVALKWPCRQPSSPCGQAGFDPPDSYLERKLHTELMRIIAESDRTIILSGDVRRDSVRLHLLRIILEVPFVSQK